MKKSLILILALCFILTGCGKNKENNIIDDDNQIQLTSTNECVATPEEIKIATNKVLDYVGSKNVNNLSTSVEETLLGCSVLVTFNYRGNNFEFAVEVKDPDNLMQVVSAN